MAAAGRTPPRPTAPRPEASAAVLEIQVVEARHIAESDEAAMTRMEARDDRRRRGRAKGARVADPPAPPAAPRRCCAGASAALDKLIAANTEIVTLSRRNSNVRSLALSLGKKRTVTAECDDLLQALEDSLAKHHLRRDAIAGATPAGSPAGSRPTAR